MICGHYFNWHNKNLKTSTVIGIIGDGIEIYYEYIAMHNERIIGKIKS